MKKLICAVLAVVLMLSIAAIAEESLKRAKAWDLTHEEWIDRFNSISELDNGAVKLDSLILLQEADYRKTYASFIGSSLTIGVMCEDTTDKVYAAVIMLDMSKIQSSEAKTIGTLLGACIQHTIYACDKDMTAANVQGIYNKLDPVTVVTTPNSSNNITENGNVYSFSNDGTQIVFATGREESFETEEEFLQYRESTLSE